MVRSALAVPCAVAVVVLLAPACTRTSGDSDVKSTEASPATSPERTAGPSSTAPLGTPAPTLVTAPNTTTITTVAAVSIARPVMPPDVCEPMAAFEVEVHGVTLFARRSATPLPVQVIGGPDDDPTAPFAIVERFVGDDYRARAPAELEVAGMPVWLSVFANGNGEAVWELPDGTQGYLRSRGLAQQAIIDIVGALSPRPVDAPIPGFDLGQGAELAAGMVVLHEQLNTEITGTSAGSRCRVPPTGAEYVVGAFHGDPVFVYGAVIDRPPPLDVATIGGTVIVVSGPDDPSAPTAADVVDADPEQWLALRSRSWFSQATGTRSASIGDGREVVLELVPVDVTRVELSYLTLSLVVSDGVAFLQVDASDAAFAPEAESLIVDVDGRRARFGTHVGSINGVRIGEPLEIEQINVAISVVDAADLVVQTTEPVELLPLLTAT